MRVREGEAVLIRVDMSKEPELARDYNVADESKIILFKNGVMVSLILKREEDMWILGKME